LDCIDTGISVLSKGFWNKLQVQRKLGKKNRVRIVSMRRRSATEDVAPRE
jgi:hypothetical protein